MTNLFKKIIGRLRKYKELLRMQWLRLLLKLGKFNNNDRVTKLQFDAEWESRIKKVLASEYNNFIPRINDAGHIDGGFQKMHNGIYISTGDYYGLPIAKMLYLNKGVHEPEEEKIFQNILSKLPGDPVMIEMGAYWSFYSMWFLKETNNGKAYMIEPDKKNLAIGRKNFQKNNLSGSFDNYFMGKSSSAGVTTSIISLDDFISKKNLKHINIAHSDIQGYELEMLEGASASLKSRLIDYFFLSTHTNVLHYQCIDFLKQAGYKVVFELDLDHVCSFDGLVVAVSPNINLAEKDLI